MSVEKKIKSLRENGEKLSAYRRACDTLRITGVEDILIMMAMPEPVDVSHAQGTELAAASLHESLGYQRCLGDLFGLEDLLFKTTDRPIPDFGANEKLGLSDEEARELS